MKYDLARMLKEIEQDEQRPAPTGTRKLTQEQIRELLEKQPKPGPAP